MNVQKQHLVLAKRASGAVLGLLIGFGLIWALMPGPVDVDTATIGRSTLHVTVDEEGKTRIRNVFVITAPIAGTMERSTLKTGDAVVKDETVIAVVKPPEPTFRDFRTSLELAAQVRSCEANVELAEAELRRVRAELELARIEFERVKTLADKGITARSTLDKAEANLRMQDASEKRAIAAVEVRKTELQNAKARQVTPQDASVREATRDSCSFEVKSPESGRVLKLIAESEQALNIGAPIMEIGDPGNLEVVVELLSEDAVKIGPGAEALIENWGGPPLRAHVKRIEPSGFTKISALGIEEQRVKTILEIDADPSQWERLGHDYRVYVKIDVYKAENVIAVPIGALFRRGEQWNVFTVRNGRAAVQAVTIGHRNSAMAEIRDGLQEGDRVVLHPSDRVSDGVRVRERLLEDN